MHKIIKSKLKIAIIGLGYVGFPIAKAFASHYEVLGYDIDSERISTLQQISFTGNDEANLNLSFTANANDLSDFDYYIITVPTPVDAFNKPDFSLLNNATKTVAKAMKKGAIVIFESTVYPGATEEISVPLLETVSGLTYNEAFFVAYSPERISIGDSKYSLKEIKKITSGSTPAIAKQVDLLYQTIIKAGTYSAPSIQVAEAAKVIENAQRDLNIAFVNELAQFFSYLDLDTNEVLKAAATKWNFMPFTPGLVGGHCIGVDPYYLLAKANEVGFEPKLIQLGRIINNNMSTFVAQQAVKLMLKKEIPVANAKALVLGITIKEQVADVRNSKVVDLVHELESYQIQAAVYDPFADIKQVKAMYALDLLSSLKDTYDLIIVAVAHHEFINMNYKALLKDKSVIFDVKSIVESIAVDGRL